MSYLKELKEKHQVMIGNETIPEVINSKLINSCGRQVKNEVEIVWVF